MCPVYRNLSERQEACVHQARKRKKDKPDGLSFVSENSDCPLNLVGTEASCTDVYMARSTVNNRFYPFDVGLPCTVGTSMRMGDLNAERNTLAADIALCHQLHLLAVGKSKTGRPKDAD